MANSKNMDGINFVELLQKYGSQRQVAKALGISRETVQRHLAKAGHGPSPKATVVVPDKAPEVASDIEIRRLRGQLKAEKERYQMALQEIEEWQSRVELIEPLGTAEPRLLDKLTKGNNEGTTAILVQCDWHSEETIEPHTVNGLNEYNLEIASRRINAGFRRSLGLVDAWRRSWKVDEIYFALLGDLITGYIHEELEESNGLSPTEALLFVEQHIVDGINFLLKESGVKKLVVPCCHGNHGRTTKKKRIKTGYKNSFEWLLYKQLEGRYRRGKQNVEFRVANGIHNIQEIRGHGVRMHHGDAMKYNGGVGGISIPVNKAIAAWNCSVTSGAPIRLDLFGHWHQFHESAKWVACNCAIGYSDFALEIKAEFQPPSQTVVLMNRTHGKVAALQAYVD